MIQQANDITNYAPSDIASARYFIVQHMPDLIRKEVRNVGVVVQKGEQTAARFFGEREDEGIIDRRAIRGMSNPNVYRMWVRHWRKALRGEGWERAILDDDRRSYFFIPGGEVTDTADDSAYEVCAYLYHMLVSDKGLMAAIPGEQEAVAAMAELGKDISSAFRALHIAASNAPQWVRYPIRSDYDVRGAKRPHTLSFVQDAQKHLVAIEPINFATAHKRVAKERAGYVSYVFEDIRTATGTKPVETAAIIRVAPEDRNDRTVEYAIAMLKDNARVIDWLDDNQRTEFLGQREQEALAA